MKNKILPPVIIISALLFAAIVSYSLVPKKPIEVKTATAEKIQAPQAALSDNQPTPLPTPLPTPFPTVKPKQTSPQTPAIPAPTKAPTPTNLPTPTPQPNNNTEPKPTPTASQTPAPSPIASIVHIEIKTPNGSSSFETEITDGMNLCDIMQKAKDSGKINSITFDDSYLSVYKSKYVQDINGFSNNWTFTVNGSTPLGCSLSNPKPNDSIIWKFG